ncbi:BREX system P-loop protein BrxC [Tsukamurella sputi]|uniref:BREX system P-loop protein BrxC n=1 Tax=Tsukamurella sputi TaxID=2591848 RepID=UPI001315233D|nr:BREX system P-loop protein BrxC [Tsukamurella sputi]
MTNLEQILAKDIDRPLDGVVKASSSGRLRDEVREYVITAEVADHMRDLLEAYTFPGEPPSNGVWIAGFFGSGKSHLLKMLAYLLGDVPGADVSRSDVVADFEAKLPAEDAILRGALGRAAAMPATSLLFNIDEKVDKNNKDQPGALLDVFVQVFYDAAGYFGKSPYIARFERDLAAQGVLDQFKNAFERHYGKPWEQGRELAVFADPAAEKAYSEVTGQSIAAPLATYRQTHSATSIEAFTEEVAQWLDAQPAGHRLAFFVDEIGQFIGQNTQLMLSLQTITESLHSRCRGRAWVLVTSQEVLESILGDRTKEQQQDFSKIQARFAIALKLDSRNVKDVVSRRLLEKTPDGVDLLSGIYANRHERFRSLFALQNQRPLSSYANETDFVSTYPFVDYQFELFHDAMRGLSDFNAFTGRHSSVGERSLLGVTKDIGSSMQPAEVGALATFDMFFDGIEKSLNSDIKQNVISASRNITGPDRELQLRLLKALLMTKYVDWFEATSQALSVLLTPEIDANIAALHTDVERALKELERATYVQRSGNAYAYLTNEEQDVEKAIKNHARNDADVKKLLNDEIVAATGVGGKIRHDATGVDLGLERWLDDERQGRTEPLSVRFITPYGFRTVDDVKQQSIGATGALYVVLDLTDRTRDDIELFVRTASYVQLQMKSTLPESRQRILASHGRANIERGRAVRAEVARAVANADLVHNGTIVQVGGGTAKDRVNAGLQVAIESLYLRINESRAAAGLTDGDVGRILRDENMLELDVSSTLDELARTVINEVQYAKTRQVDATVGHLVEHFAKPPFGWSMSTVLAVIAHAVVTGRVRLRLDSRVLVRTEIAGELTNRHKHRQIHVDEVRAHDPSKVRKLQRFLEEFTDEGQVFPNTDDLIEKVRSELAATADEVERWEREPYPFTAQVQAASARLRALVGGRAADWYLGEFLDDTEDLLDLKEDVLDPIRGFLNGQQPAVIAAAKRFLQDRDAELHDADAGDVAQLRADLADPAFLRGEVVPRIKRVHERLQAYVDGAVTKDRDALATTIDERIAALRSTQEYLDASPAAREQAVTALQTMRNAVATHSTRGAVALARHSFDAAYTDAIKGLMAGPAEVDEPDPGGPGGGRTDGGGGNPPKPEPETVKMSEIDVRGAQATLRTAADVDRYLERVGAALRAAVEAGKTVIL